MPKKKTSRPKRRTTKKRTKKTQKKTARKKSTSKKNEALSSVSIPIHKVKMAKVKSTESEDSLDTDPKESMKERKKRAVEGVKLDESHSVMSEEPKEAKERSESAKPEANEEEKKMVSIKKRKWWKIPLIVLGILVGVGVIAGLVYFLLFKGSSEVGPKDVDFSISGPKESENGEEVEYTISLANKDKVDFENVSVDLIYPNGFTPTQVSPDSADFNETKWELASLIKGTTQTITINGSLIGNVDEEKVIKARLTYKPINVSSDFTEETEATTTLRALDIDFDLSAPKSVTSGSEFTLQVAVDNTSTSDLENIRVKMVYPSSFEFKSSSPRPDFDFDTFDIETLNEKDSELIKIKGVLTGEANEEKKMQAVLGFVDEKNEFYPQAEEEFKIEIAEVVANVTTKVFNQTENAMSPGEQVEYTVKYKNTGTESFKNVRVETHLDTLLINTDSFEVESGKVEDDVVVWDKETIPELETVNPDDERELKFMVKLKEVMPVEDKEDVNFELKARSFFKAEGTEGDPEKAVQIESKNALTKINSVVTVRPEVHYYDFEGRKVGSGPLPPVVSKKTTYRIYLMLSNTTNEVDDGIVEVTLPDSAQFTGSKSTDVGTIILEENQAIWTIGKIPAHTGQFTENIEAYIDISIVPGVDDIGKTLDLTEKIMFTGVDVFTDQDIKKAEPNVSTDLIDDPFAMGKGEVRETETKTEELPDEVSEEGTIRGDDIENNDDVSYRDYEFDVTEGGSGQVIR